VKRLGTRCAQPLLDGEGLVDQLVPWQESCQAIRSKLHAEVARLATLFNDIGLGSNPKEPIAIGKRFPVRGSILTEGLAKLNTSIGRPLGIRISLLGVCSPGALTLQKCST